MNAYFMRVHSSSGATSKLLVLKRFKPIDEEWVGRAERLDNPRVYHTIDKYQKFDELFVLVGVKSLAGCGSICFYQAKKPLDNCHQFFAIVDSPGRADSTEPFMQWHEASGRYYKKMYFPDNWEVVINTGTFANPVEKSIKDVWLTVEPKATYVL